jgi:hypothetical protein
MALPNDGSFWSLATTGRHFFSQINRYEKKWKSGTFGFQGSKPQQIVKEELLCQGLSY